MANLILLLINLIPLLMSSREKLKNKVKKLLQSGKSQAAIAEQLSLSRHVVHQLKQSIIQR